MGLLFIDGFDHYTTITQKYGSVVGTMAIGAYGRFSTNGMRNNGHGDYVNLSLPASYQTIYTGFAVYVYTSPAGGTTKGLISFVEGTYTQVTLGIDSAGHLYWYRGALSGDGGILLADWGTMSSAAWHYIESKVTFSNTVGQITMKCDGVTVIDTSANLDTVANASAAERTNSIRCFGSYQYIGNPGAVIYFDDFWIADDAFYGDCRVETRLPSGEGNYEQWTKSAGSHNYECVDETTPSTTDYVSKDTADSIDTYTKAALTSTAGTIKGVAANMYVQKSNAGVKQIAGIARLSGSDLAGSGIAVPSSWAYLQQFLENPDSGDWTISDINSAEFGVKVIV